MVNVVRNFLIILQIHHRRSSPQNNPETITNEHDEEIPKERHISPDEKQKIIDDLRSIQQYNNGISKNNKFVRQ